MGIVYCGQSTAMASAEITEESVYLNTGNPLPRDIENIATTLLNEEFTATYQRVSWLTPPRVCLVHVVVMMMLLSKSVQNPGKSWVNVSSSLQTWAMPPTGGLKSAYHGVQA
jgi:replication factor C subunit 3/5